MMDKMGSITNDVTFTILHQNIRSLRCNFLNFKACLQVMNVWPDVIVLSEIWIYEDEKTLYELRELDYTAYFHCNNEYRSGGVVIYCKNHIRADEHPVSFETADVKKCTLNLASTNITIVGMYRKQSFCTSQFNSELQVWLDKVSCRNLIVVGDINIDLLKIDVKENMEYLEIMNSFGLISMISEPTRVTCNINDRVQSATLIDHVFIRSTIQASARVKNLGLVDHFATFLDLNLPRQARQVNSRVVYKLDEEKLKELISVADFTPVFNTRNVDLGYKLFEEILIKSLEGAQVPRRIKNTKNGSP